MRQPDGREDVHHVSAGERSDRPVADQREGMVLERCQPLVAVLAVAPAGLLLSVHGPGDVRKADSGDRRSLPLCNGIDPLPDLDPRLQRCLAGLTQGHRPDRPQRKVTALAGQRVAQMPVFPAGGIDDQHQPVTIRVAARRGQALHLPRGQFSHRPILSHNLSHDKLEAQWDIAGQHEASAARENQALAGGSRQCAAG